MAGLPELRKRQKPHWRARTKYEQTRFADTAPLLVLLTGRGVSVTIWIAISVTFFPAYVQIAGNRPV
jgi:hypothetical protein